MKSAMKYCALIPIFILTVSITTFYGKLHFFRKNEASDLNGTSVFFMETNVSLRYLSEMNACGVESAAKHNPQSHVIFYKVGTAFDPDSPLLLSLLSNYSNIRFDPLDPDQLFRGTPLQSENGSENEMSEKIRSSPYPEDHMSDVGRATLLWKYGGIYLDTDLIVLRPLDTLANFISREVAMAGNAVNSHVIAFEKNSQFLHNYLTILRYNFTSIMHYRIAVGGLLIGDLLMSACGVSSPPLLPLNSPEKCGGINVFPYQAYSTVHFYNAFNVFLFPESQALDLTEARVVHYSHSRVKGSSTAVGSGSYLDLLFKENCPVVYEQIEELITV